MIRKSFDKNEEIKNGLQKIKEHEEP